LVQHAVITSREERNLQKLASGRTGGYSSGKKMYVCRIPVCRAARPRTDGRRSFVKASCWQPAQEHVPIPVSWPRNRAKEEAKETKPARRFWRAHTEIQEYRAVCVCDPGVWQVGHDIPCGAAYTSTVPWFKPGQTHIDGASIPCGSLTYSE
jgi:hypothetical protein